MSDVDDREIVIAGPWEFRTLLTPRTTKAKQLSNYCFNLRLNRLGFESGKIRARDPTQLKGLSRGVCFFPDSRTPYATPYCHCTVFIY